MKIDITEQGKFLMKEVFEPIILEAEEGNKLAICMRDNTFEMSLVGSDQWHRVDIENDTIIRLPVLDL